MGKLAFLAALALTGPLAHPASADDDPARPAWSPESGKLIATAGVIAIEGAGGGGLTPWALITGYGTRDAIGANAHYTYVRLPSFSLQSGGMAVGLYDRLEVSFARQWFDTGNVGARLGLGAGYTFAQDIAGVKLRLFGDAIYDQDSWLPQVAIGLQYKANNRTQVLSAIGARSADGVDVYMSATKLILAQNILLSATVRATRANQFGLLGFGGDRNGDYTAQLEGSAVYLLSHTIALGAEYRTKPDNLRFAHEDNAWDLFGAWFASKNASVTLAYTNVGRVAGQSSQSGLYLSLQTGF